MAKKKRKKTIAKAKRSKRAKVKARRKVRSLARKPVPRKRRPAKQKGIKQRVLNAFQVVADTITETGKLRDKLEPRGEYGTT